MKFLFVILLLLSFTPIAHAGAIKDLLDFVWRLGRDDLLEGGPYIIPDEVLSNLTKESRARFNPIPFSRRPRPIKLFGTEQYDVGHIPTIESAHFVRFDSAASRPFEHIRVEDKIGFLSEERVIAFLPLARNVKTLEFDTITVFYGAVTPKEQADFIFEISRNGSLDNYHHNWSVKHALKGEARKLADKHPVLRDIMDEFSNSNVVRLDRSLPLKDGSILETLRFDLNPDIMSTREFERLLNDLANIKPKQVIHSGGPGNVNNPLNDG